MVAKLDKYLEGNKLTREQYWEQQNLAEKFGPCSQEAVEQYYQDREGLGMTLQGFQPFEDDETPTHKVDTSSDHARVVPQVASILALPVSEKEAASACLGEQKAQIDRIAVNRFEACKKLQETIENTHQNKEVTSKECQ